MNSWHSMGGWEWAAMGFMVVFVLAVAALVVSLVAAPARDPGRQAAPGESAREILDRRFASGALDLDSYRHAVEALAAPEPRREGDPR